MSFDIKLRTYQEDAINKAREAYREGNNSVCLVLPCRSGKTVIAAYIAKRNTDAKRKVLFLVHRIELCEQTEKTFVNLGVDMNYCKVMMIQTATKRISEIEEPYFIIVDEGHHGISNTYRKVFDAFPNCRKLFLTATPTRLDGKGLGNICDSIVVGVTANWLKENNYLSDYDYYAPTLADFSDCKKSKGDFEKKEVAERMSSRKIYGDVVKHYKEICNGKKAIAYCASVEHSKKMCEEFNSKGIPAAHIDGKTPKKQREEIMKKFRTGEYKILCNYEIVGEGLDVPDCEVCLLIRPTASLCLFVQMACRCLTYKENKRAIILDFVGNYERFNFPTIDREWSLKDGVKKQRTVNSDGTLKVRVCQNCFGTFKTADVCPYCGEKYKVTKKELETIEEARLQKVQERVAKRKENYQKLVQERMKNVDNIFECTTFFEISQWCKVHGKKQGYGYIIAKKKGLI